MNRFISRRGSLALCAATLLLCFWAFQAQAQIEGITGTSPNPVFNFVADTASIQTGDGFAYMMFLFAVDDGSEPQYPGPTLVLREGDTVTINLRNNLPAAAGNVSLVFPGHKVTATGGVQGVITREAEPGGVSVVTYTFTVDHPGSYQYHCGTRPDFMVEMGLAGAIIVRPLGYDFTNPDTYTAYGHEGTFYGHEELYFLTEMDPIIHDYVEAGQYAQVNTNDYFEVMWFINGRNFPDLMTDAGVPWLPNQPYNCQPKMHAGDKFLIRLINAGRDAHPMHYHGNDFTVIAINGRMLESAPGNGPDLGWKATTFTIQPGQTADLIWTWSGRELGWDFFGHAINDPMDPVEIQAQSTLALAINAAAASLTVAAGESAQFPQRYRYSRAIIWRPAYATPDLDPFREIVKVRYQSGDTFDLLRGQEGTTIRSWAAGSRVALTDHGKPFPVIIPPRDDLAFGQFYHGSPFMGAEGDLPPSHPGLNVNGGFFYMWHSHTEKELTNNDIWPGGYVTFMIVEPPNVAMEMPVN